MKTILKSNGQSVSGKTYYFDIEIPANVLTIKAGSFNGTSDKPEAAISEISWMYNFGKKYFSITKNGKYKLENYFEIIKEYYGKKL
jgi:hypothetical protein